MTKDDVRFLMNCIALVAFIYLGVTLGWKVALAITVISFAYGVKAVIASLK